MKKRTSIFLIATMTSILAVMFVFMCLPLNHVKLPAVDGVLDLREQSTENAIFPLRGQWHFYYGSILTPADLAKAEKTPAIIDVPSFWTDNGYPAKGCATYRLVIKTEYKGPLMLYVPEIFSAYTLWVNGEQLGGAGVVSSVRDKEEFHYSNALIPVRAKNGGIDLCLEVSNFSFIRSGMHNILKFGRAEDVLAGFFRTRTLYALGIGCLLMMGFYHLALYMFRRSEHLYLLFALLCINCFLRFSLETDGLNHFFQIIPGNEFAFKLYRLFFFGNIFFVMLFSCMFFEPDFLKKYKLAVVIYGLVGFILAFASLDYVDITLFLFPILFLTIVHVAKFGKIRETELARLYIVALVMIVIVGITTRVVFYNTLYMPGLITNLFLIMSQGLVLSQNYSRAFAAVEEINANLEQIIAARTSDLQNINNAMKELIANISHDLKTPLAVMSVNLETLLNLTQMTKNTDYHYQRHVRIAYHKNLDLQRLTQNLFEVNRIETGQYAYAPKWVFLQELFSQVQEKYADFLESEEISFDVSFEEDAQIWIDPQKIWSVFDNIIYNAVRHTEKGGLIAITAVKGENAVTISVKDTGEGIAPEHLPHIFDRFYKVSSARGTKGGESGAGLYIVKSSVEGVGGSVTMKSAVGEGTCIVLSFQTKDR